DAQQPADGEGRQDESQVEEQVGGIVQVRPEHHGYQVHRLAGKGAEERDQDREDEQAAHRLEIAQEEGGQAKPRGGGAGIRTAGGWWAFTWRRSGIGSRRRGFVHVELSPSVSSSPRVATRGLGVRETQRGLNDASCASSCSSRHAGCATSCSTSRTA